MRSSEADGDCRSANDVGGTAVTGGHSVDDARQFAQHARVPAADADFRQRPQPRRRHRRADRRQPQLRPNGSPRRLPGKTMFVVTTSSPPQWAQHHGACRDAEVSMSLKIASLVDDGDECCRVSRAGRPSHGGEGLPRDAADVAARNAIPEVAGAG